MKKEKVALVSAGAIAGIGFTLLMRRIFR